MRLNFFFCVILTQILVVIYFLMRQNYDFGSGIYTNTSRSQQTNKHPNTLRTNQPTNHTSIVLCWGNQQESKGSEENKHDVLLSAAKSVKFTLEIWRQPVLLGRQICTRFVFASQRALRSLNRPRPTVGWLRDAKDRNGECLHYSWSFNCSRSTARGLFSAHNSFEYSSQPWQLLVF